MTQYILSTMTNSVSYANWGKAGDLPVMRNKVTIKGGTGLPSISSGFGEVSKDGEGTPLWTADGVITPISDEQYDLIKDHKLFKQHIEKGFIKVLKQDISGNHKAVKHEVASMERRDGFAQLTPATLGEHTKVKISTREIENDTQFRL